MISAERKTSGVTVRVHDEYCQEPSGRILQAGQIVSLAYRRQARDGQGRS